MRCRFLLPALIMTAAPAAAQFDVLSPIPDGRCMLVVASRQTLDEARDYIDTLSPRPDFVQVFPSSSGWYAITVGSLTAQERDRIMPAWKESGRIPQDSYCSSGSGFGAPVDWRAETGPVMAPGGAEFTADGYLRVPRPEGGYYRRRLRDGQISYEAADGTITTIAFATNVGYDDLPSLSDVYDGWAQDLETRVDTLAEDILAPGEMASFGTVGSDLGYFNRTLLRLTMLELIAERRR